MSFKNLTYLIITSLFLLGCSEEKKDSHSEDSNKKSATEEVIMLLEFKNNINDVFKVYYSDDPNLEITGENVISKTVFNRGNDFQTIKFKFPIGEKPYKLRIDLGLNQKSENITIKNISLLYKDKIIDGDDGAFLNYWGQNQSLVWDNENYFYKIIPFEGNKTPILISNQELNNQLLEFYK
jgi:hypothetical protein